MSVKRMLGLGAGQGCGGVWLVLPVLLAACVPVEARGGRSEFEIEIGGDSATCALDGYVEDHGGPGDASSPVVDVLDDGPMDDGPMDDGGEVRPTTGFRLEATPLRAEVERGGRVTYTVRVVRATGFVAPIVVQAWGLPPGCAAEPVAAADLPAALVVTAEGLAPATSHVPFAIGGSAAGHRATLRAEIAVTGPPIFEE